MKHSIQYKIKETLVQVIHDDGEIVVKNGVLIEGEQFCAIDDIDEEWFPFFCALGYDLTHMFSTNGLTISIGNCDKERHEDERNK